jgi:hypothetical protein
VKGSVWPVLGIDLRGVSTACKLSLFAAAEHGAVPFAFAIRRSFFAAPAFGLGCTATLFLGHWGKRQARPFYATLFLLLVESAFMAPEMGCQRFTALFAGAEEVGRQP